MNARPLSHLWWVFFTLTSVSGVSCGRDQNPPDAQVKPEVFEVKERVERVRKRLMRTGAGQIALDAMQAHGGLSTWYQNGPLSFVYRYRDYDRNTSFSARLFADTWRARSVHWLTRSDSIGFGWDGKRAWRTPPGAELPVQPAFWSLAPSYWLSFPFVLGDPGVILTHEADETFGGKPHFVLRAMFEPGTGSSPDDYFVVLIDQEMKTVSAIRFVVTHPALFPRGGFLPENLAIRAGEQVERGISFPDSLVFQIWSAPDSGSVYASLQVDNISFDPTLTHYVFVAPATAEHEAPHFR